MESFDAALDHNYGVRLEPFTPSQEADLCSKLGQPEPETNRENRLIEAGLWLKTIASGETQLLHWYFGQRKPLVDHKPVVPIPLDGLVRADHFLTSGHFDLLEIWENDSHTDNLMVGVHIGISGDKTHFPLYRWGSIETTIAEIRSAHSLYWHHLAEKKSRIMALRISELVLLTLAMAATIDGFVHVRVVAAITGVCLFMVALFCGAMTAISLESMHNTSRKKALDSLTNAIQGGCELSSATN